MARTKTAGKFPAAPTHIGNSPLVQPAAADRTVGFRRNTEERRSPARFATLPVVSDDRIVVGRRRARLEGFENATRGARRDACATLGVDADKLEAGRHAEWHARLVGKRELQEVLHDRRRGVTTRCAARDVARLVVTEID